MSNSGLACNYCKVARSDDEVISCKGFNTPSSYNTVIPLASPLINDVLVLYKHFNM